MTVCSLSDVSWLSIGYLTPETLNRIHILWLGGQGQHPDAFLAPPLITSLARWHCSLSSFKQNKYWKKLCWQHQTLSAVYRCIWSHWQFHRQRPTSLWGMQHQIVICSRCFTVRFRHFGLNSFPGNRLTYVWAQLQTGRKCFHRWRSSPTSYNSWWRSACGHDSRQLLSASFVGSQTEPKAPATHCLWAGSSLAHLPPLMQEFKRFQFTVGQRYAAMCMVLAIFMLLYRLMRN